MNLFFTADYIHNGHQFLPENSAIEVDEQGIIIACHQHYSGKDTIPIEGLLCPGFVNTHCHLELSYLKGVFEEGKGLIPFLMNVPSVRGQFSETEKKQARFGAVQMLIDNGVVAVGDIANTTETLDIRAFGGLHIHSFIEAIGFVDATAQQRFASFKDVHNAFLEAEKHEGFHFHQSIVPHAPYSVSASLFQLINEHEADTILSIHNQESQAETDFFLTKKGDILQLFERLNIDIGNFIPSGKSSLQTYAPWIDAQHQLILVHNTFSTKDDIACIKQKFPHHYWCLCPNANLFLENKMPPVLDLMSAQATICIGTDSLASNHELNIFSELMTLKKHFTSLDWNDLLRWATINGAKALGFDQFVGSFEVGKKPGLIQIIDWKNNPKINRIL